MNIIDISKNNNEFTLIIKKDGSQFYFADFDTLEIKGDAYDEYIGSIVESNNEIAIAVKMDDLIHNMKLSRFTEAGVGVLWEDEKRANKYSMAFHKLTLSLMKCKAK